MRVVALLWLGVVLSWNGVSAQVGHEPGQSPYRDVRRGAVGVITFGYLGGSRVSVGVGLSDGKTGGIRYEALFGAIGASLGIAYGRTNRFVVDPTKDSLSPLRKTGPFPNDVVLADAGLQLVLTGRKTWRGFAPFVGGALGVAIGGAAPRDSSGYRFGTKFTIAPNAGLRWYPARRLSVRGDFRLVLWKLNYPVSYQATRKCTASRSSRSRSASSPPCSPAGSASPWVSCSLRSRFGGAAPRSRSSTPPWRFQPWWWACCSTACSRGAARWAASNGSTPGRRSWWATSCSHSRSLPRSPPPRSRVSIPASAAPPRRSAPAGGAPRGPWPVRRVSRSRR